MTCHIPVISLKPAAVLRIENYLGLVRQEAGGSEMRRWKQTSKFTSQIGHESVMVRNETPIEYMQTVQGTSNHSKSVFSYVIILKKK